MNEIAAKPNDSLLEYQARRLQSLIQEILGCCQERTSYLSKKYDMPQAELRCLMLFGNERYQTVKGISRKLDVAKSRVTKIINGLMRKNLVESIDDPKDARIKLLSLTPAGQVKSQEIDALITDLHQKLLLEFESEQRKTVLSCLEMLRFGMEAIKKQMV